VKNNAAGAVRGVKTAPQTLVFNAKSRSLMLPQTPFKQVDIERFAFT
jgi:hypothetical protein